MGNGLIVIVPDDFQNRDERVSLWEKHGADEVVSEIGLQTPVERSNPGSKRVLFDAVADRGRVGPSFNFREVFASTVGLNDLFNKLTKSRENDDSKPTETKSVSAQPGLRYVFHPVVYTPQMLELRKLIEEKRLGDTIGIEAELSFMTPNRGERSTGHADEPVGSTPDESVSLEHELISIVLVFWLRGRPDGMRVDTENRMLFWYGNGAVEITLGSEPSDAVEGCVDFNGSLACKGGSVLFDSNETSLSIAPLDEKPYRHPLPEGDAEYYFILDTMESICRGKKSSILPEGIVREAFIWYNNVVASRGMEM